jgi:hypothetical protein
MDGWIGSRASVYAVKMRKTYSLLLPEIKYSPYPITVVTAILT